MIKNNYLAIRDQLRDFLKTRILILKHLGKWENKDGRYCAQLKNKPIWSKLILETIKIC